MSDQTKSQRIRDLLTEDRPLVLGGVYDGLSARLAHRAGFDVLFMGGFSVAATLLGGPEEDWGTSAELATNGSVLVAGVTGSPDFPTRSRGFSGGGRKFNPENDLSMTSPQ